MKQLLNFLHMFWLWFTFLLMLMPSAAVAQVYPITCVYMDGDRKIEDRASAVCIGNSESGRSLLLTVKHAVDVPLPSIWITHESRLIRVTRLVRHKDEDLALMECDELLTGVPIGDETPIDQEVVVSGFGPTFANIAEDLSFNGRIEESGILRGVSGQHVMPGDSGGAVVCSTSEGNALVGIITDHEGSVPAKSRRSYAKTKARTGFVSAEKIYAFVQTQYGNCQNGLCRPIRIRPSIRQPMIGIGLPIGPPQIVHEAVPVPRPDPIYVPQQQPQQDHPQIIQGPPGPAGPIGRTGPAGLRGEPGMSITREQIEATVSAWLDSNREALRGERGPAGESFSRDDLERVVSAWLEANRLDLRAPPPTETQVAKAAADVIFSDPEKFRGPPGRDGVDGSAGPKGDRYVAVPDDEAFRQHVERWLTANPQYKDLPGLSQRIADVEAVLAKKQPVQILNADGSVFSEDKERGILDPIVIRLEEPK